MLYHNVSLTGISMADNSIREFDLEFPRFKTILYKEGEESL